MSPDLRFLLQENLVDAADLIAFTSTNPQKIQDLVREKMKVALREMESNAKNFSLLGEDGMTAYICSIFNQSGIFSSKNEPNSNGHVDIVIECPMVSNAIFCIKGEAKIWSTNQYCLNGFDQLNGYLTGVPHHALFLYYFRGQTCDDIFSAYIDELITQKGGSKSFCVDRHGKTEHTHLSKSKICVDHYAAWMPKRAPRKKPSKKVPNNKSKKLKSKKKVSKTTGKSNSKKPVSKKALVPVKNKKTISKPKKPSAKK